MPREEGKLSHMLGLLDAAAWDRLRLFLKSPHFNRSAAVLGLMEVYLAVHDGRMPMPTDRELLETVDGGGDFDPVRLKNLRAALQRKLDDFLSQEALIHDPWLQDRLLLQQLNHLGETDQFPRYHQRAVGRILEAEIEEEQRQLMLFHASEAWDQAQLRLGGRAQGQQWDESFVHAWNFFQVQVIKYLVRVSNRQAIEGSKQDDSLALQLLGIMDQGHHALPILRLYRLLWEVFSHPDEPTAFDRLVGSLQEEGHLLAPADAREVYTGALNHCIRRINAGKVDFAGTLLGLYKDMDKRNLLLVHNHIPAAQFKNMVGLALRFREYEWAQDVINRYGSLVDQDAHGNAGAFNQGMLHFSQAQFDAAERCFNQVLQRFEDIFYGLDARIYLLRIYYETANWLGLDSMVESFRMLLKRNRHIPKAHRDSYLHSVRFVSKLAKLPDWKHAGLAKLRAEVAATAFAGASKQWLLEKLDLKLAHNPRKSTGTRKSNTR